MNIAKKITEKIIPIVETEVKKSASEKADALSKKIFKIARVALPIMVGGGYIFSKDQKPEKKKSNNISYNEVYIINNYYNWKGRR